MLPRKVRGLCMPRRSATYLIWKGKWMKRLKVGTRASKLAMIQTRWVVERLKEWDPALEIEIEPIRTTGDALTHVPLTQIGGDGVFVIEIERALLEGRIELAVHSLKHLGTSQAEGLRAIAVATRVDVRQMLEVKKPAPGQGALELEMRDEPEIQMLTAALQNAATQAATSAERMFMRRLGAGCYLPVAAYGEVSGELLTLRGLVISLDGREQVRVCQSIAWTTGINPECAEQLGARLAEEALAKGAAEIIKALGVTRVQERQHA